MAISTPLPLLPHISCENPRVYPEGYTCLLPLRAAVLEKMPLVERGGPQVDEEAKESKEVAQLSEAAPVPTETQVRSQGSPGGRAWSSFHTEP